jgi:hypothetical protein
MGQRANYIIKENDLLTIHYHHWRANTIAADLYLGEKRFLAFVKECKIHDELLDVVWMEGCVVIDLPERHLYFWFWEMIKSTSVVEYYLTQLQAKWEGWTIERLPNQMYDVERILGINYLSTQPFTELFKVTEEMVVKDKPEEWENAIVVIKEGEALCVVRTGDLCIESIVSFGQEIIPLLKAKHNSILPVEEDDVPYECVVIDLSGKKVVINESSFGLLEQSRDLWRDFDFIMGNLGYIEVLELAGISASHLRMSEEKVMEEFNYMIKQHEGFDPLEFAKEFLKTEKEAQFHSDFFDDVRPKKTLFEKIKLGLRKMFTK